MFCRSCGTQNADGAPTCISCGAQLTQVNPFEPSGAPAGGAPVPGGKPANYLVQAILVTLCCCLPFGIIAIVYAAQVDSKWNAGDHQGAIMAAGSAKTWVWIGFGIGLVAGLLYVGFNVLLGFAAAANAGGGGGF